MKSEKMSLCELSPTSKGYSVVVRVVAKSMPQNIFDARLLHQILLVEDEQGHRMRAVLFGRHVEQVEPKFLISGLYEIFGAPVIASDTLWKSGPNELNYQLHVSSDVAIHCLSEVTPLRYIDYQTISQIRERGFAPVGIDVLGVVLYIATEITNVAIEDGNTMSAREIVLTDPSCEEPLFITLLDSLATNGCPAISLSKPDFLVISFTGLLTSADKGFSLITSMATTVAQHPVGHIPDALRRWAVERKEVLVARRNRLLASLGLPIVRRIETLSNLKYKTAHNTDQGAYFWVKVVFDDVYFRDINAYVGCTNCEGPTPELIGTIYQCNFCFNQICQAQQCLYWTCVMADDTGTLPVTLNTGCIETIMLTPAPEIANVRNFNNGSQFEELLQCIRTVPIYLRVSSEKLHSQFPWLMWRSAEVQFINEVTGHPWAGCAGSPGNNAGPSITSPKLPESIVKAVSSRTDVHAAYINSKSPLSVIKLSPSNA